MHKNISNRVYSLILIFYFAFSSAVAATQIVARPEKLVYPQASNHSIHAKNYLHTIAGVRVFFVKDDTSPVVNIDIFMPFGKFSDPQTKPGLSAVFADMLVDSGAGKYTADQIDKQLATISANMSMNYDRLYSNLSFSVPATDIDKGIELLNIILTKPKFEVKRLYLQKQLRLQQITSRYDRLSSIVSLNVRRLVYGNDFFINNLPTKDSIEALQQKDLHDFYRQWMRPKDFVVAISGNIHKSKVESIIHDIFKGINASSAQNHNDFKLIRRKSGLYLYNRKGEHSASIVLSLPGVKRDNSDYFPIIVMNEILGGGSFNSRLMTVLREEEGLTYGAHSYFTLPDFYAGPFVVNLNTSPDKVYIASKMLILQLQKMQQSKVTADELLIAKHSLLAKFYNNFSSSTSMVNKFAVDGVHERPYINSVEYKRKLNAVTVAQVLAVAKKYLQLNKSILLISGDVAAMKLNGMRDTIHNLPRYNLNQYGQIIG